MEGRPIWMPDTSTINVLADDPDSEALIGGLEVGVLRPTSVHNRLRVGRHDIWRPQEAATPYVSETPGIGRRLHRAPPRNHQGDGRTVREAPALGVTQVNLRLEEAENEILREENFDDELATQEREEGRTNNKMF